MNPPAHRPCSTTPSSTSPFRIEKARRAPVLVGGKALAVLVSAVIHSLLESRVRRILPEVQKVLLLHSGVAIRRVYDEFKRRKVTGGGSSVARPAVRARNAGQVRRQRGR